jgi:hypothetical protein
LGYLTSVASLVVAVVPRQRPAIDIAGGDEPEREREGHNWVAVRDQDDGRTVYSCRRCGERVLGIIDWRSLPH